MPMVRLLDDEKLSRMLYDDYKKGVISADDYVKFLDYRCAAMSDIDAVPVTRCRDCKYFEIKTHWAEFGGVPIIGADNVPTCEKWGNGCKTAENGFCFLGEAKDGENNASD